MRLEKIQNTDGTEIEFDVNELAHLIYNSGLVLEDVDKTVAKTIARDIERKVLGSGIKIPSINHINNLILESLSELNYIKAQECYINTIEEDMKDFKDRIVDTLDEITHIDAIDSDIKRENANINGDSSMGVMLKYGSETAKIYNLNKIIPKHIAEAHINGDIHIHDLDFYTITETCCQIDLEKLFKDGFNTGHGYLREPNNINSYGALAAIAIQANQNDMHKQLHC